MPKLPTGALRLLVLISLIYSFNLSAFLVEAFWLLISLYGLIKFMLRSRPEKQTR